MTNKSLPDGIHFGREICGDLKQAEQREWWLANRNGTYAAGTIATSLTRRYHGLLIAPLTPPLGRFLVLSKADATLIIGNNDGKNREWPLFTNRWSGGSVSPEGYVHIESFRLQGRLPVWHFSIGDIRIEQRIWLAREQNAVHVAWRRLPGGPAQPLERERGLEDQDNQQLQRVRTSVPALLQPPLWIEQLLLAADNFVFKRP
jgi:4-alpha-glucanotransferase